MGMKKLLGILVLGLILVGNAYAAAGYKVKIKEQNEYGSILSVRGPAISDKASKWNKSFNTAEKISTKHCNSMSKNTYAFWSQKSGIFARNSMGNLLSWRSYTSHEEHFAYGFIQDYQQTNPLAGGYILRYFCAKNENEALDLYSNYFNYFNYDFSPDKSGTDLYFSVINNDPYNFKNFDGTDAALNVSGGKAKKTSKKKSAIEEFKEICTDLGLTHGTSEYVDCVLKLKSDEEKMIMESQRLESEEGIAEDKQGFEEEKYTVEQKEKKKEETRKKYDKCRERTKAEEKTSVGCELILLWD